MIGPQRSPHSPRSQRSPRSPRSPPLISYPLPIDHPLPPPAPPSMPSHSRKPSVTNPMTWLSRSNTTSSKSPPYSPSKPVRISEPKFNNMFDMLNHPRSGPLGSGATVVKTPHEALCGTAVHLTFEGVELREEDEIQADADASGCEKRDGELPSPPQSPPLPPVPLSPIRGLIFQTSPELASKHAATSASPTPLPPPPAPPLATAKYRPSLKIIRTPPNSVYAPPVPTLPSNITATPPQPPFEAILVSPVPTSILDPAKVIVSLETSTATHRTTLSTLTSRPSHLSTYLTSLLPSPKQDSDSTSINSQSNGAPSPSTPDSPFHTLFQNHLASAGLLPPSTSSCPIHIFLDRPSAPYAHILSYLRTVPSTPECPASLPHGVQPLSPSNSRLEALLELRDEARYLNLDELHKLCVDEIRQRHTPQIQELHKRGYSSSSSRVSGSGMSNQSSHTMHDRMEPDPHFVYRDSCETKSMTVSVNDIGVRPASVELPRSPVSQRRRSQSLVNLTPPAGWI